ADYAKNAVDEALQKSSLAVGYDMHPLGLKLVSAAGRIILPNLTEHPARFSADDPRHWVRPEELGLPNLPSRWDLLIAGAVSGKLQDCVGWHGTVDDLASVYSEDAPEHGALIGRSLARDYFPHGGLVGGAQLVVTAFIRDQLALTSFSTLLDGQIHFMDSITET